MGILYALLILQKPKSASPEEQMLKKLDTKQSNFGIFRFVLSVSEWVEKTEATGLFVKRGKYGGTYAHKDIAFNLLQQSVLFLNDI